MNKFIRNLLTEWRKLGLPFEEKTVVVAVSGGADSVSLLIALAELRTRKKLNLNFVVAHFNHNLRGEESDKDEKFVENLARRFEFKCEIGQGNIPTEGNLEQNARIARYKFLSKIAEKHNAFAVLTAHTQNDQAETFLLNLIRGSGLDGLAGMEVVSQINKQAENIKLVRPLLNWAKREETEEFCSENKIEFRQDEMNDDLKFSRVKVRKELIPFLQKLNPQIIKTLSNTANLLRNDVKVLSNITQKLSNDFTKSELENIPKPLHIRILREWLGRLRGDLRKINLKHIEAIRHLIFSHKSGMFVELPNGEKVLKRKGKIVFERTRVEKSEREN